MSNLSRRQLLIFFGSSAAASALAPTVGQKFFGGSVADSAQAALPAPLTFTPVRLAPPLEIYQDVSSFYATGIGQGNVFQPSTNTELNNFTYIDDVVVPPEYERYVIVRWGDRVFPNSEEYFGYNCDYTGYVPINGDKAGYLFVNHEYVGFPISPFAPDTPQSIVDGVAAGTLKAAGSLVLGDGFPRVINRTLLGEFYYNTGVSVLRIGKRDNGRYSVNNGNPVNRRIHGLSGLGINSQRTDAYQSVTSWGTKNYQKGDQNYLTGTGPAATEVFEGVNSDGLGNKIIGTSFNCSGGTSPWGTFISAEENFQAGGPFFMGVTESVKPNGSQTGYTTGTSGAEFGQVGEKYGWMVEVDPTNPKSRARKHTALGRYRHENIAMRAEAGQPLIAYLGDDRRGGHTWKFVSSGTIASPTDKGNSALFESGTLYVAKFNPNGTGRWVPLTLSTPTDPIPPTDLSSVEFAALGSAQRNGRLPLPRRISINGGTTDGGVFNLDRTNEATFLPLYRGKTLADFYTSQGAVLCDAFLAANLVGGTPGGRPEDIEVHPVTNEVFVAYTDGAPGGDGYPDSRIFVVAKYSAAINATQQSGGLYKIIEDSANGAGTTFRWERFAQAGEDGAVDGTGFANVDNLVFDSQANIWGVTDMSTGLHNGFDVGVAGTPLSINHAATGNTANLVGVFGNNSLFFIPTSGPNAGKFVPFAYGPPRCEMTGPTFLGNDTLILAVQHPGEDAPIGDGTILSRTIEMLNLDGTALFNQTRNVPRGSNWPSNIQGQPNGAPRPSVIGIRRIKGNANGFV
jgi:secreted PhoX family phosphatase